MGQNCCCFKDKKASAAYRYEFGSELVKKLLNEDPTLNNPDARIVFIYLKSIKNIEIHNSFDDNPFVEMRLKPKDPVADDQYQRSSYKASTLQPVWEPAERFQFIIRDIKTNPQIALSLLSFKEKNSIPIGDTFVKLDFSTETAKKKSTTVKLNDSQTGKSNGLVSLDIVYHTINEALSHDEHSLFQYERYSPLKPDNERWGSTYPGHFLPTDPGINPVSKYTSLWSSPDGLNYYLSIEEASPKLPEGWKVTKPWYILSNENDPDGWEYAGDFTNTQWHPREGTGLFVRRRKWSREVGIIEKQERESLRESVNKNGTSVKTRRGRKTTEDD